MVKSMMNRSQDPAHRLRKKIARVSSRERGEPWDNVPAGTGESSHKGTVVNVMSYARS
jgi:hypothetical protein